jgi:pilus assembly protein CpaB
VLRRATAEAFDTDEEPEGAEGERRIIRKDRAQGLDGLRAEVQRKLAAQIDLGTPEPATAPDPFPVRNDARARLNTLRAEVQNNFRVKPERKGLAALIANLRGRRIRMGRLVLVLIALGAGGLAAYLATQTGKPVTEAVVAAPAPAPEAAPVASSQILVARAAIGIGQRLSAETVEWQDWPADKLRPEYVTLAAAPEAITEMAGTAARFEFFPGEPIRQDKLALPGQGYLSAVLTAGMRAVAVSITPDSASGGFIVPNDRVDVLLTRAVGGQTASETVLRNVRVLAINQRLGETGATGAPADAEDPRAEIFAGGAIATLELDANQAEIIASSGQMGAISLALRAMDDYAAAGAENAANAAIRITSPFWAGTGTTSTPQ